jgi:16S rRNA (uracil1498-N3)-methyltransferase
MRITRIFQPVDFRPNKSVRLSPEASHHLSKVLRARADDEVLLFNGRDEESLCIIEAVEKNYVMVKVGEVISVSRESDLKIHLGQVMAKGDKMDFVIQKAVELGMASITPLSSERCDIKLPQDRMAKKIEHWQQIVVNACEQSGRTRVPLVLPVQDFNTWIQKSGAKIILDPRGVESLKSLPNDLKEISITVGPEGGFSETEINLAREAGCKIIQMGPRILRTETAALAAISVLQLR